MILKHAGSLFLNADVENYAFEFSIHQGAWTRIQACMSQIYVKKGKYEIYING